MFNHVFIKIATSCQSTVTSNSVLRFSLTISYRHHSSLSNDQVCHFQSLPLRSVLNGITMADSYPGSQRIILPLPFWGCVLQATNSIRIVLRLNTGIWLRSTTTEIKKNLTKITTPLHVTVIHVTTGMYNKYMNVLSSKIKYY